MKFLPPLGFGRAPLKWKRVCFFSFAWSPVFLFFFFPGNLFFSKFFSLHSENTQVTALSGAYTIGGTNPDYNTFTDAVNDLHALGVSGSATFNVRNGFYDEQISIDEISGVDATNVITFQSESGDSNLVILSFASSSSGANYTLRLNGADWLSFRQMTIRSTGSSYRRVVEITGTSNHNTFSNNVLQGALVSSSSTNYALVYSPNTFVNEHNVFENNLFKEGSYGIYYRGNLNNSNYVNGIKVLNNSFQNQYYCGVYLYFNAAAQINHNQVTGSNTANFSRGIWLDNCRNACEVMANRIYGIDRGYGVDLDEVTATAGEPVAIVNNFIQIGGATSTSIGINVNRSDYQSIYHNTIHITSTSLESRALYDNAGSNNVLLNNIFANTGGGYAVYSGFTSGIVNSDYNDLYSSGEHLAYRNGAPLSSLADWRVQTTFDSHSFSFDPFFRQNDDYTISQIGLNGTALFIPQVTKDIEGETRDVAAPDIGADEWTPPPANASLFAFANPTSPFAAGNQAVEVLLENSGDDPLTLADIDLEINDVMQPTYHWTGSLPSGDTVVVNLGNANFAAGQIYHLKSWVSNPNGVADPFTAQDTIVADNLSPGLAGIYTIGGASPDFATFTEAVNALTIGGVIDSVIFKARNGIYNEQIDIGPINGVDSLNRIRFQSESEDSTQVVLTYGANSSANYTWRFNGADWISLSGMTLEATGGSYARVVEITNEANHISLKNNIIKGAVASSFSNIMSLVYASPSFLNEYFTASNNVFLDGSVGIEFGGNSNGGNYASGIAITGNTFQNQYGFGVYLTTQNFPRVNNNFLSANSGSSNSYSVYISSSDFGAEVKNNQVIRQENGRGIYLLNAHGQADKPVWVVNNFVRIDGADLPVEGIYSNNGSFQNIYFNTVNLVNPVPTSSAFYNNAGSDKRLLNNIFSNGGGGYALRNSGAGVVSSDFNNLYTTGSTLINWDNTLWSTLADWQNGGNGAEANSLSINPYFISPSAYQVAQSALNGAATPGSGVTEDIDGDLRDPANPDIGADEFSLPAVDAGIAAILPPDQPFDTGNQLIRAVLQNHGVDTVRNVTINWKVNDLAQTSVNWTGTLASSDSITVDLGNVNFSVGQGFDITSWTTNPDGAPDPVAVNDTAKVENLYSALNGVYTLGGASPDFPGFTAAANTLKYGGLAGNAIINVRDGVYNEQVVLNEAPGADSLRQVVFQSESGDSSQVTLTFDANSSTENYTLKLNGLDWAIFRKMTLEATNNTYGRVVEITNESNDICFENNVLQGVASTSSNTAIIYSPSTYLNERLKFKENVFQNGYSALNFSGHSDQSAGIEIENNQMINQYREGIYLRSASAPKVTGNLVTTVTDGTFTAIYIYQVSSGAAVTENMIYAPGGNTGVSLVSTDGSANIPVIAANNFIYLARDIGTVRGINITGGSYHKVVFNSVHIASPSSSSYGFYNSSGSNHQVLNNIFVNSAGGRAYYNNNASAIIQSDYNDLYTTGAMLGYYAGTTYTDLDAWKAGANQETHSISEDPLFVSNTDLHVSNNTLNNAGIPIVEVSDDIDGETRDPTNPDIGADEFTPPQDDAGVLSIDYPSIPFPTGELPILITLKNNGADTLNTLTLNWKINGDLQAPVTWDGFLLPGISKDSIELETVVFEVDTMYSIQVWASAPNGKPDLNTSNDSAFVTDLYAGLSGIYTIGGQDPNYPDFTNAVNALTSGGITGSVIFNVRDGTYNEQIVIPEIVGADSLSTITFQSESGDSSAVRLTYDATSSQNYTLQLNGADWTRFQKMTLEATNTYYSRVVEIFNEATNNIFADNEFIGVDVSGDALIYSGNTKDDNNHFISNRFLEGNCGLYYRGKSFHNITTRETGTIIKNNTFIGQSERGIELQDQEAPIISNNYLTTSHSNSNYIGLRLDDCFNDFQITGNEIVETPRGRGIRLDNGGGDLGSESLIANNFIQMGENSLADGIYLRSSPYCKIYHNTIHITSSANNTSAIYITDSDNLEIVNNIFVNSGVGYTINKASGGNMVSDYNNLYSLGTNIGRWDNVDVGELAEWQSTSGQDANSLSLDPLFVAPSDLHITEIDLNNLGTPLSEVNLDFDGDVRDPETPDMGADEFFPVATHDAQVEAIFAPGKEVPFPDGVQGVKVVLKNGGADTLLRATLQWRADNLPQIPFQWIGYLLPGERDTFTIGSFNFEVGKGVDIEAYTQNPNNAPDNNPDNDTARVKNLFPALAGVYTVGGALPDFETFKAAAIVLNNGGVLGPVTLNVRNGTYFEQFSLKEIVGVDPSNPLIIQSEAGDSSLAILEYAATHPDSNYLIQLNGSDHVTIRKMTLRSLGDSRARIIELTGGANHNSLLNCHMISSNNFTDFLITSGGGFSDNENLIQHCRIENGGRGVDFAGTSLSLLENNNVISRNTFLNQREKAVDLFYQDAPKIQFNTISSNDAFSTYEAVKCTYCDNGLSIYGNKIQAENGRQSGIYVTQCDATASAPGLIANNSIYLKGDQYAYGLYTRSSSFLNVYYNSVHIANTHVDSRAFYNYYGSNINALNNIFSSSGGGYAYYVIFGSSFPFTNTDFNCYYSNGPHLASWNFSDLSSLADLQAASGKGLNSLSVDPLFYADESLRTLQVALDGAAIPISDIAEDIESDPRNPTQPDIGGDEFDPATDDLGVLSMLTPVEACNLSAAEIVKIAIQNYGALPQSGFDVVFSLNGEAPIVENTGARPVPAGDTIHFSFSVPINLADYQSYSFKLFTRLPGDSNPANDTATYVIQNHQTPALVSNMLPADSSINISRPVSFSWFPSTGAQWYDLYFWEENTPFPSRPQGQDLSQITYVYNNPFLRYGAKFHWQVVAKGSFCETPGPIQSFTMRELPDLIVQNVEVPPSSFSGQSIEVSWEVKNDSPGSTDMSGWHDYIYFSNFPVYKPVDAIYLGGFSNLTALNAGESYTQTKEVRLPEGVDGTYYIFVITDKNIRLEETDDGNNIGVASTLISLTPPPDLQVTSIITPNNTFSNTAVNVIWTVTNEGEGDDPPGAHVDRIYLSDENIFNPANALFLKEVAAGGFLERDSSYQKTTHVLLPPNVFGDYFIHIVTDYEDDVYEHVFEYNNASTSDTINVILQPHADLVVSNVIVSNDSVSNREGVILSWMVKNQGAVSTYPYPPPLFIDIGQFSDRIYISPDEVFNPASAEILQTILYQGVYVDTSIWIPGNSGAPPPNPSYWDASIAPGDSVIRQTFVAIPPDICDNHYFYIETDTYNDIYEYDVENNNISRSDTVYVKNADLIVTDIEAPDTIYTGEETNINWTVKNQGPGDARGTRTDRIYMDTDSIFNPTTAIGLGTSVYNLIQAADSSLQRSRSPNIPNGLSGQYYLHAYTDQANSIFEKDQEGNNTFSKAVTVMLSSNPDLQVDTLRMLPDIAMAGQLLTLEYVVRNHGSAPVGEVGTWQDRIYISANPVWNIADAKRLKSLNVLHPLGVNETYTNSTNFVLPMLGGAAASGICYIYVVADYLDRIYEHNNEDNNVLRSNPIFVSAPPSVDFHVLNASTLPDTVWSGQTLNLQWMIQNQGSSTGLWDYPLWYDGVYICEDSIWHPDYEDFVKDFTKEGPLGNQEMYSNSQMFTIPPGVSGDYYAFLVADHTRLTNHVIDDESIWKIRTDSDPQSPFAKPIHIKLSSFPDLVVNLMQAPNYGVSGQPIPVVYTVRNNGTAETVGSWTDKIYLSTDFEITPLDPITGSKPQSRIIAPGETYTDTIYAEVPISAVGNYVLILKTDANEGLFEFEGEENNTFFTLVNIALPLPADLIVNAASFDTTALVGEPFSVTYSLYNRGVNPASGFMQDLIYLSADAVLSASDVQFAGPIDRNIDLAPDAALVNSVSNRTPGLPPGDYFVLVQTDIRNNIYENFEDNNVFISNEKVRIDVPELPLDSLVADSLYDEIGLYYRLEIPDSLTGQTIRVSLNGMEADSQNELYLEYGEVPTRFRHDYASTVSFEADQQITIPEVQGGTYYLLAYGLTDHVSAEGRQAVTLKAEIINFTIQSVRASKGGNTGNATLKITGAKFSPDMSLQLAGAGLDTIVAHKLYYTNSTEVFATFNLSGAPLGLYDLAAFKEAETAVLTDAFEVIAGGAGGVIGGGGGNGSGAGGFFCTITNVGAEQGLEKDIQHPESVRLNRLAPITIRFGNSGDVDIPCPYRFLLSLRGAPLSFDPEDLSANLQELFLEFQEVGGPPGLLRPGSVSSITVFTFSSHPLSFLLTE